LISKAARNDNCYASGSASGKTYIGGLVGYNYDSSTVSNCFSIGPVSGNSVLGGLVGGNDSSTVNGCYWNTETSGLTNGVGLNVFGSIVCAGLTTTAIKQAPSFSGWSFDTTWIIRTDSTYPGLRALDNAPFAFYDTLASNKVFSLSRLLLNDCDVETGRSHLTLRVVSLSAGTTDSASILVFPDSSANGTVDTVKYRVGEIRSIDTLWGNVARAYITLDTAYMGVTGPSTSLGVTGFWLAQNRPNPFKQGTVINYQIPKSEIVNLRVYNIAGQTVKTLANSMQRPGAYSVTWDGRDEGGKRVSAGLYFYRLNVAGVSCVKRLVMIR
jgi:hypothetical protein